MSLLGKLFGTDDLKAMLQRQKTDFELQQKRQLEAFQEKEAATQAQNEQKIKILKDQIELFGSQDLHMVFRCGGILGQNFRNDL